MTQTAKEVLSKIEAQTSKHTTDERFVRTMDAGKVFRQGDIYLVRLESETKHKKEDLLPTSERQLAPGTSKGSRHIVEGAVQVFNFKTNSDPLKGPLIVAPERFSVTHPEHANVSLPSGTYQVGYQMDPRTMDRVAD